MFSLTEDAAHNRDEVRRVWSMPLQSAEGLWDAEEREESKRWPGLSTLVYIESERQVLDKPRSIHHRYFLASDALSAFLTVVQPD